MTRLFQKIALSRREAIKLAIPVLALVLVASVVTGREKPSSVPPEPARKMNTRIEVSDADLDLERLKRPEREEKVAAAADPFARRSFAPQQEARPEAPQAPVAPQVPPLPFTYLGKVIDDGKLSVFLARGEDSFSVSGKTKIGGEYRVDKVTETAVVFTYLPMNARQTLDIPVAQ
jgi:hypothetical protein